MESSVCPCAYDCESVGAEAVSDYSVGDPQGMVELPYAADAILGTFLLAWGARSMMIALLCAPAAAALDYDAIVVGGGLSGLWTARMLQEKANLSVAVVEARPYVGGRTQALKIDGATIDLKDL
jgi:hypothetical protein